MFLNLKALISNTRFLITFLSSIVFLMNSIAGYAQGENWRKITEMPNPRWGSGSCVSDGKIYVVGGCYTTESSPGKPAYHTVAMVNSFDPETGIWDTLAPLEVPRCYLRAVVVNGKIYAIGGSVNIFGESSSTVEVYDIENDRWERSDDMPAKRLIFGACVLENQIYVMGGLQSFATVNNPLKSMDRYDPATGIWETCADMSRAASGLTVTPYKGKIYAIGGGVIGNNGADIVEEYDPAEDVWIRKTSMSAGRILHCSAIVNDRIFVAGGANRTYPTEIYNPLTDTWIITAGEDFVPLISFEFSCVPLDKKLYVFGGELGRPIHWSDPDVIEFDFPVVRSRSGSWLTSTDSLLVEFYEDGTLFIVPKGTPASRDSIFKYQIGAINGVANQFISIRLDTVPTGGYEIFGIASDGRLDRGSSRFHVNMVGIADVNFLHALIDEGVDTNEDSLISYVEAETITILDVSEKGISDMTGLDAFVNLEMLYCSKNLISSLDVSNNIAINVLDCSNNRLKSLDVSNNTDLWQLECSNNQLSSLDISNNTTLAGTDLPQQIPSLNLSFMPTLEQVCVWETFFVDSIDIEIGTTGSPNICFQTDCNGNCSVVGIENTCPSELSIYPNPTNDLLAIETEYSDHYSINITTLNGQRILIEEMEGSSHQIDLSSFQKGVYFITIRSEAFVTTRKIIKL